MINIGRKTAIAGLIGAASYGFSSGIGSKGVSDNAYELLTGDPNIDEYVLGKGTSLGRMMMPLPGDPLRGMGSEVTKTGVATGAIGGAAGLGAGMAGGYGLAKMAIKKGRNPLLSGIMGATVGLASGGVLGTAGALGGAYGGMTAAGGGYINSKTVSDAARARNYENRMPNVDGSLVFGAWNVR